MWMIQVYLLAIGTRGTSSMNLRRDLSVMQKTAWYRYDDFIADNDLHSGARA